MSHYIAIPEPEMYHYIKLKTVTPEQSPRTAYGNIQDAVMEQLANGVLSRIFVVSFHHEASEDPVPVDFALSFRDEISRVYVVQPDLNLILYSQLKCQENSPYRVEIIDGPHECQVQAKEWDNFSSKVATGHIQVVNGTVMNVTSALSLLRGIVTTLMNASNEFPYGTADTDATVRVTGPYAGHADIPLSALLDVYPNASSFYFNLVSDPTSVLEAVCAVCPGCVEAMQFLISEVVGSSMNGDECAAVMTRSNYANMLRIPYIQDMLREAAPLAMKAIPPVHMHASGELATLLNESGQ